MILAFGHKARQGKDTAGEAVVEYYNNRRDIASRHYTVISKPNKHRAKANDIFDRNYPAARLFKLADAAYKVCREEYGMTEKDASLLQMIGDGRREQFGLDYWIKQLDAQINSFKGIAVITDVRYTNEADWVKSLGGHTINVRRLNEDGMPFITSDRDPNFISEIQLDGYNYDYHIISKSPALTAELAITISEYIRGLESLRGLES